MDKREFLEMLIARIKLIPIENILETRIKLVKKGGYYKALCPFHNDRRIGSFVVSSKKGIFKCFSCGVGGDAIKFISLYDGVSYVESAFKIGLQFGIISYLEYDEYFNKRRYKKEEIKKIEQFYMDKIRENNKEEKADIDTLNKVYEIFTSCCELSEEHKKHLTYERKLKEDRLKDYFTFPTRRIMKEFVEKLKEKNLNEEVLKTIPGFFYDKQKQKFSFVRYKGIGIKIRNNEGKIVGIQIRKDEIQEDQSRYTWFSSAFVNYMDNYEFGTSSGSPVDVVYPAKLTNPIIAITEGRFKAEKLAEIGFTSISVQGVTNWRGIIEEIKEIMKKEEYKKVYNRYVKTYKEKPPIYICFDADIIFNYQVFSQSKEMTNKIKEKISDLGDIMYIYWDIRNGKGIDDLINNNIDYVNKIKKYTKYNFEKNYEMILNLIKENENINIREINKDLFKEYFHKYSNLGA